MVSKCARFWFLGRRNTEALLLALLFLATSTALQAQFNYAITTNLTVTITGYSGPGGSVTIPDTINGLPVTSIGGGAFAYQSSLMVNAIITPNSLTNIGDYAFAYNTGLTNVTLGSGLVSFGILPFSGCSRLQAINVDKNNSRYSSLEGVLFDKNQTTLIFYPGGKSPEYTVPNTVVRLGDNAFYNCGGLQDITIAGSVTNIGSQAFALSGLTNVVIPNSVTTIGTRAFYACSGLSSVTIPKSVTSMGSDAFFVCSSLANVTLNSSVIGFEAFKLCGNLTSVTISNGITDIAESSFQQCSNLTSITMPNSVANIGANAFVACTSLANVTIPNSVTNIGASAFAYCTSLSSISIPNRVTDIGDSSFAYCTSLTNLVMGSSVKTIGAEAFTLCVSLTSITIPGSVTNIGVDAFFYCSGLTSLTVGKAVAYVGVSAFANCDNLTAAYFQGNPPTLQGPIGFGLSPHLIVYYSQQATGWGTTFDGRPTLPIPIQIIIQVKDGSFGVRTNRFGFNVTGSNGVAFVVEASTNLVSPTWSPLKTNTLSFYFSDPQWKNYPRRFYRVRWP